MTPNGIRRSDRVVRVIRRVLQRSRLWPHVMVSRVALYALSKPPRVLGGMSDLLLRRGGSKDLEGLVAVEGTPASVISTRLDRGDTVFVAEADGQILAHAWFHTGPKPFDEDRAALATWRLPEGTWWSYGAASTAATRASGLFVRLFTFALHDLFEVEGAQRIACSVVAWNEPSVRLHDRMGFARLGDITALGVAGVKALRWRGATGSGRWFHGLDDTLEIALPPEDGPP